MVMVANKNSQDQMTEGLSLFPKNNTIWFTMWLHDILDELCSVTTDPSSLKSDTNIFDSNMPSDKTSFHGEMREGSKLQCHPLQFLERDLRKESPGFLQVHRSNVRQTYDDRAAAWLTLTVKPLREPAASEDVTRTRRSHWWRHQFYAGEPLISKIPTVTLTCGSSLPSTEICRPPASWTAESGVHLNRLQFQ